MISFDAKGNISATTATGSTASAGTANSAAIGQQDFLTLMLAQLKNQDPLKPMENGEFLAQLAQFSTVGGIEKMNDTLTSVGDGMRDFRIATAANLLGHQVLVPGNVARPAADGTINGVVDLPEDASSVTITYSDANTGAILNTQTLTDQPAGLTGFSWTDLPPGMAESRSPLPITVSATTASGTAQVGPSVLPASSRPPAAQAPPTPRSDYGALDALEVEAFR